MQTIQHTGSWQEQLQRLLQRYLGRKDGQHLWHKYEALFTVDYQLIMPVRFAVRDILKIEQLLKSSNESIELLSPCRHVAYFRIHFYSCTEKYLDVYVSVLASLGVRLIDQVQFSMQINEQLIFIKSFSIEIPFQQNTRINSFKAQIISAVQAILQQRLEKDALNCLVISAHMLWQQVDVLRAYRNYYWQLGLQASISHFNQALIRNPAVTKSLFAYFDARFRLDQQWDNLAVREESGLFPARLQLLAHIESVEDINDDRILRTLFNLIDATVRSNFHLRYKTDDYFFAFKINSLGVIDMPAPCPVHEIYVHAYDMEGIHLRGGQIARGGIRWSDRPDDFRTEILGLMQTQMSKNALIIPKGAKGGFIVKQAYHDAASLQQAGKKAYITLMRGLLDLTDNYVAGKVVNADHIISYDDHDPYLVVAADKGTATFPDIANSVATDYQFWLKDAFASGGSQGYNHKQLGITARGAWESVQRHFRELNKDIQHEPFTVFGIGSMDGDVFGNGMLLSPCIRLLAAVSGQHIFIDPEPELEQSFYERKRLFDLPASSWADYDTQLISEGGGVYPRNAKDIVLSPKVKKWLGISYNALDGESLIRYLLSAQVDLLWLGGVGTYVKASTETHEQVSDRLNDRVRVDAPDIKALVVGEGANLGFTQQARIEFCLCGGKINTDAIDNSAGVDISDHEVNLKILLYALQHQNLLHDPQPIFKDCTGSICAAVLANNYRQGECISLDKIRNSKNPEHFMSVAERLEGLGLLDCCVEPFPDRKTLLKRAKQQLSRPELAVLLAASKLFLKQVLLEQKQFISAEFCEVYLQAYFPEQISKQYGKYLPAHPLADSIKATWVSNYVINHLGCTVWHSDISKDNEQIIAFISCYLTFDRVFDASSLRRSIRNMDNLVESEVQYQLLLQLEEVLSGFCYWAVLKSWQVFPGRQTIHCFKRYFEQYMSYFVPATGEFIDAEFQQQCEQYVQLGVPEELAQKILVIASLHEFVFVIMLSSQTGQDFLRVLTLVHETTEFLELDDINTRLAAVVLPDQWEQRVYNSLQERFKDIRAQFVKDMLELDTDSCIEYFSKSDKQRSLENYRTVLQELKSEPGKSLLPFVVLAAELERVL